MNIEEFRTFCLSKPGTTEHMPFDEVTLVIKVAGKMFALAGIEQFASMNLKCDPELAIDLRERYPGVKPGWHMSKKHWNTVSAEGDIPDRLLEEWITHSYDLVVSKLPKRVQAELKEKEQ
jgi:predicted DNA-binding protein (MmcQ/YjbR family)